jgi:hypothetical protein
MSDLPYDYRLTVFITISIFPCEWFLYRRTQRRLLVDNSVIDRWQVMCFVVERTREGHECR